MEQSTKNEEDVLWKFFNKYGFVLEYDNTKITGHITGIRCTFRWADAQNMSHLCAFVDDQYIIPQIEFWHKADPHNEKAIKQLYEWLGWSEEVYADYVEKGLHV